MVAAPTLTAWALAVGMLADVSCGESSQVYHDAEAVAAVAVNRAVAWGKPLTRVLRRGQFARGCLAQGKRKRFTPVHLVIAARALMGHRPEWLGPAVLFFCAEAGPKRGCARWREKGSWAYRRLRPARTTRWGGKVFHRYFEDRRAGNVEG